MRTVIRVTFVTLLCLVLLAGLLPGLLLPESTRYRMQSRIAHLERKLARWDNVEAKPMVMKGRLNVPGASIQERFGASGLAVLADKLGNFEVPQMTWFPGREYALVVTAPGWQLREVRVFAPWFYPEKGVFQLEPISLVPGEEPDLLSVPGLAAARRLPCDQVNEQFYRNLYQEITQGLTSHADKIEALNAFVFGKRKKKQKVTFPVETARTILENPRPFSYSCGELALALATLARAGGYNVRMVTLIKLVPDESPYTHVVVEVSYNYTWHLYDPTYGASYHDEAGNALSLCEVRTNPDVTDTPFASSQVAPLFPTWIKLVYDSGTHFLVYVR
ncbi:MAG: hypothetical protein K1Y36_15200 [Blastocatellia bacterium]|nr:hypothetical protein [Blastocatellia bacterium]